MRKWIIGTLLVLVTLDAAGCASVQKKFTRKRKEPKHIPSAIYLQEGPYQKKFSNVYYYKNHYTLWKNWHDELLKQLGGNHKKVTRCAQEASGHLTEMVRYLVPEKQAGLKAQADELARITKQIDSGQYAQAEEGSIRVELEKVKRLVTNDFYFDKVQAQILPDTVDLGQGA